MLSLDTLGPVYTALFIFGLPLLVALGITAFNAFAVKAVPTQVKPYLKTILSALKIAQVNFPKYFNDPTVTYDDFVVLVIEAALEGRQVTLEERKALEDYLRENLLKLAGKALK